MKASIGVRTEHAYYFLAQSFKILSLAVVTIFFSPNWNHSDYRVQFNCSHGRLIRWSDRTCLHAPKHFIKLLDNNLTCTKWKNLIRLKYVSYKTAALAAEQFCFATAMFLSNKHKPHARLMRTCVGRQCIHGYKAFIKALSNLTPALSIWLNIH